MHTVKDQIFVHLEKPFKEEVETDSGLKLHFDPMYNPTKNVNNFGEVAATPRGMTLPIDAEIKKGDIAYFHHNYAAESHYRHKIGDNNYHLVDYDMVFAVKRGDLIIPIGEWCLCEAVYDDDVTDEVIDGKKMKVVEKNGIIVDVDPNHNAKVARLFAKGSGRHDEPVIEVESGDYVVYELDADFENTIDGKKFFTIRQSDLIAKVDKEWLNTLD